jgi:hypothetical protein
MSSIWFHFETSPIKIRYNVNYLGWSEFIVRIMAIVGGMFAAAGVIASVLKTSASLVSSEEDNTKISNQSA